MRRISKLSERDKRKQFHSSLTSKILVHIYLFGSNSFLLHVCAKERKLKRKVHKITTRKCSRLLSYYEYFGFVTYLCLFFGFFMLLWLERQHTRLSDPTQSWTNWRTLLGWGGGGGALAARLAYALCHCAGKASLSSSWRKASSWKSCFCREIFGLFCSKCRTNCNTAKLSECEDTKFTAGSVLKRANSDFMEQAFYCRS